MVIIEQNIIKGSIYLNFDFSYLDLLIFQKDKMIQFFNKYRDIFVIGYYELG